MNHLSNIRPQGTVKHPSMKLHLKSSRTFLSEILTRSFGHVLCDLHRYPLFHLTLHKIIFMQSSYLYHQKRCQEMRGETGPCIRNPVLDDLLKDYGSTRCRLLAIIISKLPTRGRKMNIFLHPFTKCVTKKL